MHWSGSAKEKCLGTRGQMSLEGAGRSHLSCNARTYLPMKSTERHQTHPPSQEGQLLASASANRRKELGESPRSTMNNMTASPGLTFLLMGFPGLESAPYWLALPVCTTYLLSTLGNGAVLLVVLTEKSLRSPMYLFLCMLAFCDLGLSTALLPTMLRVFLFGAEEVTEDACFSQLFFIHSFSIMESSVLLAMAFDRFVAICNPLRYASILTSSRVAYFGLGIAVRGVALHMPIPFLLKRLTYCRGNVLSHSYCLHPDVMKLACRTSSRDGVYGLFVVFSTMGLDPVLIILSYVWILKAVLGIASLEGRRKALGTCAGHISVVLLFYTPMLALSLISKLAARSPPLLHVLLSYLHFLAPPLLNPVLYCVKMKEVRKRIARKLLWTRRVSSDQGDAAKEQERQQNYEATKLTSLFFLLVPMPRGLPGLGLALRWRRRGAAAGGMGGLARLPPARQRRDELTLRPRQ
ncbi:olfactory receptor 51G2-like, partial [Sphaerodactylus townsendi]|uniref:olfactory receptor 51G2-like n=1 Tax=Sphaerodactylus townsendi TaxID=933632 RepID=UPI002025E124